MRKHEIKRRDFLKRSAGLSGTALFTGSFLVGCPPGSDSRAEDDPPPPPTPDSESVPTSDPVPPAASVLIRKNIASLAPDDPIVEAYKLGVQEMKKRATANRTSWVAQAQIHNDSCPHGNWFFLPWHRAYLWYFESICREASGMADFRLPYWDWSTQPSIPAVFWGGSSNPLFDANRVATQASVADLTIVGPQAIETIVKIPDFITFGSAPSTTLRPGTGSGQLEGQPHNYIHGTFVRGDMATYMSPLDPIFWLHHANCDRLWTEWVKRNPTATPSDTGWLDFNLSFFDTQGNPASIKVRDLLNTDDLGYRYDTQPGMSASFGMTRAVPEPAPALKIQGVGGGGIAPERPANALLRQTSSFREVVSEVISQDNGRDTCLRLAIENATRPAGDGQVFRIYLNCPEPTAQDAKTSPYYVGSYSFFDHGHSDATTFYFDATESIKKLRSIAAYGDDVELKVSVVPEGGGPESAKEIAAPAAYSLSAITQTA